MVVSLIITFLILLALVVVSLQNGVTLDLRFIVWNFQMSLTALIFYSSLAGAAIVAILVLPKLATKSLYARKLNKELSKWKEKTAELDEKRKTEKS